MKKLKVLVSISLVAIITILSCSKENELVNEQNDITSEILERKGNPITAGDLEFVGIEHNAMLNDWTCNKNLDFKLSDYVTSL
jgi:hypothetical protein